MPTLCVRLVSIIALSLLLFTSHSGSATQTLRIAVSANFVAPFKALQSEIEAYCGCTIAVTSGASGILATQFAKGAPYDVFLSADSAKPRWLFELGKTQGAPVTYALGQLILLDKHRNQVALSDVGKPLSEDAPWRIAIANRNTAPYGEAAEQVLSQLDLADNVQIIRGNSVLQTLQFFQTGNVDQAIVSRSMLTQLQQSNVGTHGIPRSLHQPIAQQGVVNVNAAQSAQAVLQFLVDVRTQQRLVQWGYGSVLEVENDAV